MSARAGMLPIVALLSLGMVACDGNAPTVLADTARAIGVVEPRPAASKTITVLIDASERTPATPGAIGEALDRALADIASRPVPSCVVVARMGATVNDLATVGTACVEAQLRNTTAQRLAEERFIAMARERLLPLATRALADPPRQSPLAETLSRLGWSRASTDEHLWLVITDGRQESSEVARFECGPLPNATAFQTALGKEKLLDTRSLHGIDIRFCFFGFTDANRPGCASSVRRELELRELWRSALQRASAKSVTFDSGAPDLASEVRS